MYDCGVVGHNLCGMISDSNFHAIQILYGSETGTAEDVAFKLFSVIRRLNIACRIACTDEYTVAQLPTENTVLFVVSTTGDGEVPSNMIKFWRFLLR